VPVDLTAVWEVGPSLLGFRLKASEVEEQEKTNKFMSVRACFVSVHCALVLLRHGQYNEERSRRK
jgi:hypothetical protein